MTPREQATATAAELAASAPRHHGGIQRYVEHGIQPGSFLCAMLSNDLTQSFAQADTENRHAMFHWASWLYNHAPFGAIWGSREIVDEWIKGGGLVGRLGKEEE